MLHSEKLNLVALVKPDTSENQTTCIKLIFSYKGKNTWTQLSCFHLFHPWDTQRKSSAVQITNHEFGSNRRVNLWGGFASVLLEKHPIIHAECKDYHRAMWVMKLCVLLHYFVKFWDSYWKDHSTIVFKKLIWTYNRSWITGPGSVMIRAMFLNQRSDEIDIQECALSQVSIFLTWKTL